MTSPDSDVTIRIVDTWNNRDIVQLYKAGGWWKDEYDPAALPALIRGSFAFAVAVDNKSGGAIGMGRVLSDGVSDGYIQDLVVLPAHRGQGIGKQIVSTLVKRCTESGIEWIGLIAEPGTEPFYRTLGFQVMHEAVPLLWKRDPDAQPE